MENGAVWVYRGLLDDVSDDELAFVLGHELVHYTHEHSRRGTRNARLVQLTAKIAQVALDRVHSNAQNVALTVGADLALLAWNNGYSRQLEDQADRVGLRYAYEGGFDVTQAPKMWQRVVKRSVELDRVSNFFLGDHSRVSDRIRNIERELGLNYRKATR
jgi:Zn-dependent protease with chaperone function